MASILDTVEYGIPSYKIISLFARSSFIKISRLNAGQEDEVAFVSFNIGLSSKNLVENKLTFSQQIRDTSINDSEEGIEPLVDNDFNVDFKEETVTIINPTFVYDSDMDSIYLFHEGFKYKLTFFNETKTDFCAIKSLLE